jgi:hypothetical protein
VLAGEKTKRESGPSGEVLTLAGKKPVTAMLSQMGDRVTRERPKDLDDRMNKAQKRSGFPAVCDE